MAQLKAVLFIPRYGLYLQQLLEKLRGYFANRIFLSEERLKKKVDALLVTLRDDHDADSLPCKQLSFCFRRS